VTPVEALGFTGITTSEQTAISGFLRGCLSYPFDDEIIEQAVMLRQQKAMKLGDAIIAATALVYGLPLVTRNTGDFKHIAGLDLRNPFSTAP
jgi:toxin FitB